MSHVLVARARSGVEKTLRGDELLARMRDQAIEYGTDYRRSHQVFLVDLEGERKTVHTPEATVHARSVVFATGAMGRSSKAFPGEDELLGKGVSYCATCDGAFYCDEEVAVVGGTHEAIEEAEFLTKFASTVHWITPNAPKADDEAAQALLALRNVRLWSRFMVESIEGDVSGVTGVRIKPRGGGRRRRCGGAGVARHGCLHLRKRQQADHRLPGGEACAQGEWRRVGG